MRTLYAIAIGVLLPLLACLNIASAAPAHARVVAKKKAGGGGPTYLVNQNFEGTGYDNSETWTESGAGTIDEDYTTTALAGSQSLYINSSSQNSSSYITFTDNGEVWVYFLFRPVVIPGVQTTICHIQSGTTSLFQLDITSSGNLRHNSGNTVSVLSAGTTYHIWMRYVKGTGANEVNSVGFSTDGTRPTSGNNYREITNGTSTLDANRWYAGGGTQTREFIYDHVLVDETTIGDSP